jgi:hypothetical protein
VFVECVGDFGVGNVVAEHAIDHVPYVTGKAGNFAVAGFGFGSAGRGWIIG